MGGDVPSNFSPVCRPPPYRDSAESLRSPNRAVRTLSRTTSPQQDATRPGGHRDAALPRRWVGHQRPAPERGVPLWNGPGAWRRVTREDRPSSGGPGVSNRHRPVCRSRDRLGNRGGHTLKASLGGGGSAVSCSTRATPEVAVSSSRTHSTSTQIGHTRLGVAANSATSVDNEAEPRIRWSSPCSRMLDVPAVVEAVVIGLLISQIAFVVTTVYLHRTLAHRAIALKSPVAFGCRFIIWMSTGTRPRQWVAVHRKHHAHADKEGDPHSPVVFGYSLVQFGNALLYRRVARILGLWPVTRVISPATAGTRSCSITPSSASGSAWRY